MIVQCPSCAAKFKFPDDKVKPGVKVRCSKCKSVFELKSDAVAQADFAPATPKAPAAPATDSGEKFNFGGDFDFGEKKTPSSERAPGPAARQDFDLSGNFEMGEAKPSKEKAKPAASAPAKEESEEFSFEDEADFSSEEFGSGSGPKPAAKDANLGFSAEMPGIPGKGAKKEEPEDAGFEDNIGDFKIDRGEDVPAKPQRKSSAEDLDFSGKLESYARPDKVKGKSSSDDLEAQLDLDTESPPVMQAAATAQVHAPREHLAPERPMVRTYEEEKGGSGGKIFLIFLLLVLLGAPAGGLVYLNSTGSFTFQDLKNRDLAKLKSAPEINSILVSLGLAQAVIKGEVAVLKETVRYQDIERRDGSLAIAVTGRIRNDFPVGVRFVQVQVDLYDANRNVLASGTSYADVSFTLNEIKSMPETEIRDYMETKAGRSMNNLDIKPGEARDFAVIFFKPARGVASYDPAVLNNYELLKKGG